ncbi:uncharacterized protein LOC130429354 [Triplophysa dalaica]|uniref:uncharacterized protein LOC130429354 n=1 Tax=Triplophysa dalaica TaxID=1582913 RepID=UPI0024DFFABE|nr:uncharacterized protein LOC130429354 [Triplophysa dalaica]
MDNACQPKMTEAVCISGYIHDVSPVKTSKRNNKYFNAVCQNGRDEYHDIVVFTADKHGTFTSAAGNKTAIKMNNVKRELKNQDYVIMCNRQTTIDVTNLTFEYRKNKMTTQLTIAQLKEMDSHQMIPRLSAHVCHVNTCTEIIQNNNNDCEIKKCEIADQTATIQLVLWESYMDKVLNKTSYNFTDLATRMYNGEKYLTTTRYTTVTALDTPIANTIAPNTAAQETSLLEMTSTIEGVKST